MSKLVKDMITKDVKKRLEGVNDCVLVNMIGIDANKTCALRKQLRAKDIHVMVVKTSLAKRACEGTSLAPAFDDMEGSLAMCWGAEDFVSLVKEVTELDDNEDFPTFVAKGGVMDGEALTPEKVKEISKWPSRAEQLSMLVGQILGPGSTLAAQLKGPGAMLASQLKQISEKEE